jgi:hypothetical protein
MQRFLIAIADVYDVARVGSCQDAYAFFVFLSRKKASSSSKMWALSWSLRDWISCNRLSVLASSSTLTLPTRQSSDTSRASAIFMATSMEGLTSGGGRTDVLQDKPHFNKATQQSVGQSHTHEPYSNTNPKTGETRIGADRNNAHRPTYDEVKNIESGQAKRIN